MAQASTRTKEEKFQQLKYEIRAILISANDGLTPTALDRDYQDINGYGIPYREFGFSSLYHFLDGIPDTIDAFQRYDQSEIILFAKSTGETQHMENLIARQRKMPRVGRFGGIIQKPPEECRGTKERRQMITNRILQLLAKQPEHFMKPNEISDLYETRYGEKLDPNDDFDCTTRIFYEVKLGNFFDVKDIGHGGFWVRLRDTERQKILAGVDVVYSRPTTPSITPANVVAAAKLTSAGPVSESAPIYSNPSPPAMNAFRESLMKNQAPTELQRFKENLRHLLLKYPKGVEISVLDHAYHQKFGEQMPLTGADEKEKEASLLSILRGSSQMYQIVANRNGFLVKPHFAKYTSPLVFVAPKNSPACPLPSENPSTPFKDDDQGDGDKSVESDKLAMKLRPDADQSGTAHRHEKFTFEADDESQLSSLMSFFEVESPGEATRKKSGGEPSAEETRLVQKVWDVIMKQREKTLSLHQIPAVYEDTLDESFPSIDVDHFGMRLFDYEEWFSFKYEGGELEVTAEPVQSGMA